MAIALLSSLSEATGNNCTAIRIRDFLQEAGETVQLVNVNDFADASAFARWETQQPVPFHGYIGIHAYRAGRLLLEKEPGNFILIFGGTDLNENVHQPKKLEVMRRVCTNAAALICFSTQMKTRAQKVGKFLEQMVFDTKSLHPSQSSSFFQSTKIFSTSFSLLSALQIFHKLT